MHRNQHVKISTYFVMQGLYNTAFVCINASLLVKKDMYRN